MLRRIRISGHRLKSLELSKGELEDIEIDAPNLSKCDFDTTEIMPVLFSENVTQFTMHVTYSFKPTHGHIDSFWFLKLREFLGVSAQSINLKVYVLHNKVSFDSEDLSEVTIPPLVEVEHLELVAAGIKGPLDSEALIDDLLWSCHPKTITVCSTNKFEKECIEVLEELLGSDQPQCCTSSQVKCWRDALKSAELVEIELPHYLKNLSIADAPLAFTPKVRFRLDWDL